MQDTQAEPEANTGPFPQLTEREREVAEGLALGHTTREIAKKLKVSIKTIDTHRGHVLAKLDIKNAVELAHMAIYKGYIEVRAIEPAAPKPKRTRGGGDST